MRRNGFDVWIEKGAGQAANYPDSQYEQAGCTIVDDVQKIWTADVVLKGNIAFQLLLRDIVRPPEMHPVHKKHELEFLPERSKKDKKNKKETTVVSFVWPGQNEDLIQLAMTRRVTLLGMDLVPRISKAQKLDALSSTSNIAGNATRYCAHFS